MVDENDGKCKAVVEMDEPRCPKCGAIGDELDFYKNDNDDMWHWNCFNCGYDWCSPGVGSEMEEYDDEEEEDDIEDEEEAD